jgi:hypothetical protein
VSVKKYYYVTYCFIRHGSFVLESGFTDSNPLDWVVKEDSIKLINFWEITEEQYLSKS